MKTFISVLGMALLATGCGVAAERDSNQASTKAIINVNSNYRVVSVEPSKNQIGVALVDADPYVIQSYVHVHLDTAIAERTTVAGWARDQMLSAEQFYYHIQPGQIIHVEGGRDWDMTIVAKKIWF